MRSMQPKQPTWHHPMERGGDWRLSACGSCRTAPAWLLRLGDSNPEPPIPTQAELDAESGRGLMLVEALSTGWGWQPATEWHGKVVWMEIKRESLDTAT